MGMGFVTRILGRVLGSRVRFMMGPDVRFSVPSGGVLTRVKVRLEAESVSLPAWSRRYSWSISRVMDPCTLETLLLV